MQQNIQILMDIIKSEILQTEFDPSAFLALSEDQQQELALIAKKHSLAQLLGDALGRNPSTKDLTATQKLFNETMLALNYTSRIETERTRICCTLRDNHIPFIQLKGARIRSYYPEPWMRTSCDNDILVPEDNLERAVEVLVQTLHYTAGEKDFHDVSLYSQSGAHLELHFTLHGRVDRINQVLDHVWDSENTVPVPGSCEFFQTNEFFMFHVIAHLVNHILSGGCGLRPLIDLYLLQKTLPYDHEKLQKLCQQAGIAKFYENLCALIEVWFESGKATPAAEHLEWFIVSGAAYGSKTNKVAVEQTTTGKKMGNISYSLLLPYQRLSKMYPVLKKHRWLMPICQFRRLSRLIFKKRYKKIISDFRAVSNVDQIYSGRVAEMLAENGLDDRNR